MFYFLVLVLLFAHNKRFSVSSMQDAVNVEFFWGEGGGVGALIYENLFVS